MNIELVKLNEENFALAIKPETVQDGYMTGRLAAELLRNQIEFKEDDYNIFVKINKYDASVHSVQMPDRYEVCECGHVRTDHNPYCDVPNCTCQKFVSCTS